MLHSEDKLIHNKSTDDKFREDRSADGRSAGRKKTAVIFLAAFFLAVLLLFLHLRYPWELLRDYQNIGSEKYDTVLLSMYPLDTYHVEDIAYWRGMTVLKMNYCLPDLSVIKRYFRQIESSGNVVATAYLGIRPEKTDPQKLQELIDRYPNIRFEIILASPSAAYWQALSEKDYEKTLTAYCDLLNRAPSIGSAGFYFFGSQEWLVSNPDNYETPLLTNEMISRLILANSDVLHPYLVNADTAASYGQELTALTEKLRNDPDQFPDLSDYGIVFFGDSIMANYDDASTLVTGEEGDLHGPYRDTTSIAGILTTFTGAKVYNCSQGGVCAALGSEFPISMSDLVNAFFNRTPEALPQDTRAYEGITDYLNDPPEGRKLCYVINFGLNDYFNGFPVTSSDPYDMYTYCGAIRTAVKTIRENSPDSRIILCTPNFIGYKHCGTDINASGLVLKDYVEAVKTLAAELSVDLLDNYNGLGIDQDNFSRYLSDEVHPNQRGRYLLSKDLISLFP